MKLLLLMLLAVGVLLGGCANRYCERCRDLIELAEYDCYIKFNSDEEGDSLKVKFVTCKECYTIIRSSFTKMCDKYIHGK